MTATLEHPAKTAQREQNRVRVKCAAVMTVPRVGWLDARGVAEEALRHWSIPILARTGVFWAEGLQNMLKMAVAEGYDWILTIDFDSMFTAEHVARLMGRLAADPTIDAVAAMQPRRKTHTPIGFAEGSANANGTGLIRVSAAHFGLTLIRTSALMRTPLPWFLGVPNADGEWLEQKPAFGSDDRVLEAIRTLRDAASLGDNQIDADVWFWKQWARAGNTVFIDPECCIGHLEVGCVYFEPVTRDGKRTLEARTLAPDEWRRVQQKRMTAMAAGGAS